MKDYKKETSKMIVKISDSLAQVVASSSFEFWERKDFRLYVDFAALSQTEQDRMFNELEVSVLGLFILYFQQLKNTVLEQEKKIVFGAIEKDLAPAFIKLFSDLKIEKKYIDIWEKLIDLRLKEYRQDYKIALKESDSWEDFKGKDEDLKVDWARIETITIDCLSHIRRGKVEKDDPLWKLLRKWFISLHGKIAPIAQLSGK